MWSPMPNQGHPILVIRSPGLAVGEGLPGLLVLNCWGGSVMHVEISWLTEVDQSV